MQSAMVQAFHSPDIDLEDVRPVDPSVDEILIQVMVGSDVGEGADTFDIVVCTPSGLSRLLLEEGEPMVGRHYLFVRQIDIGLIKKYLEGRISGLKASDWEELARLIGRFGRWEFEDYREFDDREPNDHM
jgi:hypothetical protein